MLSSISGGAMATATHLRGGGDRCWRLAAVDTKGGGGGGDGGGNQSPSPLFFSINIFVAVFLWPKAAIVLRVAHMHGIIGGLGLMPLLDPGFKVGGS